MSFIASCCLLLPLPARYAHYITYHLVSAFYFLVFWCDLSIPTEGYAVVFIIIDKNDIMKAKNLLGFSKEIGGWRTEDNKQVLPPTDYYKMKLTKYHNTTYENEKIEVKDEYDTQSICEQIVQCNPVFIKGRVAGTGKSYIGEYMKNLGYNVLFVVPNHKQLQEVNAEATTYNKFFSIPVETGETLPEYDHSDFDCVVFDEMGQVWSIHIKQDKAFHKQSNNKIIIGTADGKQLPPIVDLTNTQDHEKYPNQCLNQMFKYQIYLTICKRVKTEEDRQKMDKVYNDIWKHKLPLDEVMPKYFETTNNIMEAEHNIAYTNRMCKWVSNTIRKNLGKSDKYEVGDVMICRKAYHTRWYEQGVDLDQYHGQQGMETSGKRLM